MALIVETGEGLANAESLVDLPFLKSFASSRGHIISTDDAVLEQQLRKANDYIFSIEGGLKGVRATAGQSLPFPRRGLYAYGTEVAHDIVPLAVAWAVCQLVVEGIDALPSSDGRIVASETVGPISTTYAQSGTLSSPSLPRVETFLKPFLITGSFPLTAVRV